MTGGTGNDLYIVESATDIVTEAASAGTDTVVSYVNYTLGANVENLILRGTAAAGTGNTLNNTISGNASANTLDGGAGADAMAGGAGNDTYVRDNAGDTVTEAANAGTDTVKSSLTYTLGANVENLTLTGAAAINGTGNTLNNVIGNAAANVLTGGRRHAHRRRRVNTFVFNSTVGGFDTVTDWHSATDTFSFSMAGVHVGDGDTTVENAVVRTAPGGFRRPRSSSCSRATSSARSTRPARPRRSVRRPPPMRSGPTFCSRSTTAPRPACSCFTRRAPTRWSAPRS